jgi:hypothetical protein
MTLSIIEPPVHGCSKYEAVSSAPFKRDQPGISQDLQLLAYLGPYVSVVRIDCREFALKAVYLLQTESRQSQFVQAPQQSSAPTSDG